MSLWIIILAYLIAHYFGQMWRKQRHQLVRSVMGSLHQMFKRAGFGSWRLNCLLAALIGAVVVLVLQLWLKSSSTVAWFTFSTLIMVFSLGSRDLDRDVRAYLNAETDEERNQKAERLAFDYRHPVAGHSHEAVIKGIFYQSLCRWFGVIFWFLVFGAAGAIGFRLMHSQVSDPHQRALFNGGQISVAKRVISWIDLIPAALATLALAIVGDFERVIQAWKQHFVSQNKSILTWDYAFYPTIAWQMVMAGDEVEDAFEHDYEGKLEQVNAAMSMVWRCLGCWLIIIALMILLNWLN